MISHCRPWGSITKLVERFADLERIGNMNADACRMAFLNSIVCMADLTQLLLGVVLMAQDLT
jgi:hypothetical protein